MRRQGRWGIRRKIPKRPMKNVNVMKSKKVNKSMRKKVKQNPDTVRKCCFQTKRMRKLRNNLKKRNTSKQQKTSNTSGPGHEFMLSHRQHTGKQQLQERKEYGLGLQCKGYKAESQEGTRGSQNENGDQVERVEQKEWLGAVKEERAQALQPLRTTYTISNDLNRLPKRMPQSTVSKAPLT